MALVPIVLTVSAGQSVRPVERRGEPVGIGVRCPRGAAAPTAMWLLTNPAGMRIPVQTSVLECWPDGSIHWMLVEFRADITADGTARYLLSPALTAEPLGPSLAVDDATEALRVSTGVATVDVRKRGTGFIKAARTGDAQLLAATAIRAEDGAGQRYEFQVDNTRVERRGPLSTVVRLDGHFVGHRSIAWLDGCLRLQFFAGLGTVVAELSVTNPQAAQHPGGTWDLGDSGSVFLRELWVELCTEADKSSVITTSLNAADGVQCVEESFSVYQDSSGGENWQHLNHVNRNGEVPATFRGFRCTRDGRPVDGLRATPIASVGRGAASVTVAMPRFWQMFPKAIAVDRHRCVLSVFPREHRDLHELQGGERTTLQFAMCFGPDSICDEPLAWLRERAIVWATPVADGSQPPTLTAGSPHASDGYLSLLNAAIASPHSFEQRRELIDEYGWRNFGDLFADHEAVRAPLVSHYNNQYDALAGFITRFLATGDARWRALVDDLALHVADVDLYHTNRDRAAFNGGHFWHTEHYSPAATATHRAYSRRSGSLGGGPSAEHNYTTGLMLHYFLTGSERSRDAVLQLANWVINIDNGWKSRFRWIDRRDTGLASATRSVDFHGPGRGAGNSINALLDAHRLTSDPRYLDKAEALVARCVHPEDDVNGLGLLDVENRWSYTVFFQVLGKYLEYRAERGLIDDAFEYARATLVRYARWMAEHERPYLEAPEQLEFPTETWAAQDLRKAAVFEFAARFTGEPETSARFVERASYFVDHSIAYLLKSPTAHLTRPIVLLLAYGFQRPQAERPIRLADQPRTWPPKVNFVPQRQRVVRRLAWAGAGMSAAALLLIALLAS